MRRPIVFVVLSGLAAMLASVVVYSALRKREAEVQKALAKNVEIVVAAYDLPLGTKIEPGELKMARWSADSMPEGAMRTPAQAVGAYVKNSFVANEPIVESKLFIGTKTAGVMPLLIPFGMRAVSVPVDEVSDIAGFVLPHTRVDVLVAVSGNQGTIKAFSKVVLQDVEVLAVAQDVEMKNDKPQVVKVVTLLVTPQEAERLALASREGTLRLAMRNYNDNKIVLTSGTDIQQMLHAYSLQPDVPVLAPQAARRRAEVSERPKPKPFQVEIYRNGKSSESVSFINEAAVSSSRSAHKARSGKQASNSGETPGPQASSASPSTPSVTAADAGGTISPASAGAGEASLAGARPEFGPNSKTIDVP
jgi:pilus assembly protein CpaB